MSHKGRTFRRAERDLKRAAAAVFAAMLLLGWIIQGICGLEQTLLSRDFYVRQMEELSLYSEMRKTLLQQFEEGRGDLLRDSPIISEAAAEAISESWVRGQVDYFIRELLLFIKGQRQHLHLAARLDEQERIFREALLRGFLERAPQQLARLELPEAALREFVQQIEFPDQVVLLNLDRDGLPESSRQALELLRFSRGLLSFAPFLLLFLLAALGLLWSGPAGGLKLIGRAALGSALSFRVFLAAAGGRYLLPAAAKAGRTGLFASLFGDGPAVVSRVAEAALSGMGRVSLFYGAFGLVVLGAGIAAAALEARRRLRKGS